MHAGGLTQAPSSIASLVTSTCIRDILKILKNQLPSSDHNVGSVTNVNDRFLFFWVSPRLIPTCYDLGFRSQPQGASLTSPWLAHWVVGELQSELCRCTSGVLPLCSDSEVQLVCRLSPTGSLEKFHQLTAAGVDEIYKAHSLHHASASR